MPRPTSCPEILVAVFAFAAALIGLGAWLIWPRPTVVQQEIPAVEIRPDIIREIRRQAIVNPMQGYQPQMPGANK